MNSYDSLVCITQTPWKGDFQKAVVQLMTELSVRNRVLYVDYPYTLKDLALGLAGRRDVPVGEVLRLKNPLTKKTFANGGTVYVWTPPAMLPLNWLSEKNHDRLLSFNVNRLAGGIRRVMRQLGMTRPLVVNAYNPVLGLPLLGRLGECATVYYCFDEITKAGEWMSRHGKRYEPPFLRRVDAVVTTSETLQRAKSAWQPRTYCVKNGANFELFNTVRDLATAAPTSRPVVGYLGSADNRIDLPLVESCVRALPEVEFQFIGEVHEPALPTRLGAYPNVRFILPHQPAELPPLLASWKAAMIPFVCNEHTYTIYPLKINEYLAAGLPVVTTPFSMLDEFYGVVEVAAEAAQFVLALRRALADDSPRRIDDRVAMARGNSWEKRAEEFEAILERVPIRSVATPAGGALGG